MEFLQAGNSVENLGTREGRDGWWGKAALSLSLSKLCSLKGTGGERHSIHSPDCEAVVGGCGD